MPLIPRLHRNDRWVEAIKIAKIKASLSSQNANVVTSKDLQNVQQNMLSAFQNVTTENRHKITAFDQATRPEQIPELGNFIKCKTR